MDKFKPYKAYVATGLSFVAGVVLIWVNDDDPFTKKELASAVISSAVGSGIVGAGTWWKSNPKVEQ